MAVTATSEPGGNLLLTDLRLGLLFADEARYRIVRRLFGVSRDQSTAVTLIALALLGGATQAGAAHLRRFGLHPASTDVLLGVGFGDEVIHLVGGPTSREIQRYGPLIALALAGSIGLPATARALRQLSSASQRMRRGFGGRYRHRLPARRPAAAPATNGQQPLT